MTDETELRHIPVPTLRRMPRYLHYLRQIRATRPAISSTTIGEALRLDSIQVRKDLEYTGLVGRPRIGYSVPKLVDAIETLLGWNNPNQAFLVGAGRLGGALLGYAQFRQAGLEIVAAFDADPTKVGQELQGKPVLPMTKLPNLAKRMHVMMGIITVPADAAQNVADLMVAGGIRAIWNFAPVTLDLPSDVVVQNEDLYSGLAALSQELAAVLRSSAERSPAVPAGRPVLKLASKSAASKMERK